MVNYTTTTTTPTVSTAELTSSLGMEIYAKLRSEGGVANTIKLSLYDPENIKAVDREIDRIVKLIGVEGVITPAVLYVETGEEITPAVVGQIEILSDILDVETVIADYPVVEEDMI